MNRVKDLEQLAFSEMNLENFFTFLAQFFGLIIVARWFADNAVESTTLTISAVIIYIAYLLFRILRIKQKDKASREQEYMVAFQEQTQQTQLAQENFNIVNEKLTILQRKYDEQLNLLSDRLTTSTQQRETLNRQLNDYRSLFETSKKAVDDTKEEIAFLRTDYNQLQIQHKNVSGDLEKMESAYSLAASELALLKAEQVDNSQLKQELKSTKTALSRMIAEVKKHNPEYSYSGKINLDN